MSSLLDLKVTTKVAVVLVILSGGRVLVHIVNTTYILLCYVSVYYTLMRWCSSLTFYILLHIILKWSCSVGGGPMARAEPLLLA